MRKKMIISESQLKRLMENRVEEHNINDVAESLKTLECTGEGVKGLVENRLTELGYTDIRITFIGHEDETNNLMYSIYTEGPMFVIKAQSSGDGKPCMDIIYVQAYQQV